MMRERDESEWMDAELVRQPLPIADALLNLDRAEEPFERATHAATLVRTSLRFCTGVAMAARILHPPPASSSDSGDAIRGHLLQLRRRGLTDGAWWSVGRELLRGYADTADAHPLPRLVELVHGQRSKKETGRRVDELLRFRNRFAHETPPGRGEAAEMLATVWPLLRDWTTALGEVWADASLVVPAMRPEDDGLTQRAHLLMGTAPSRGRWRRIDLAPGVRVPAGAAMLVDRDARPVLALGPAIRVLRPSPEREEEVFFLDGRGGRGRTRYLSLPNGLELEEEPVWEALDALCPEPETERAPVLDGVAPFRGLASFGPEHSAVFFGREKEIVEVANLIRETPLLTLTGPSGVGKTSLLRAGVGPSLQRSQRQIAEAFLEERALQDTTKGYRDPARVPPKHVFVYARPGSSPYLALRGAIDRALAEGTSVAPPSLSDAVANDDYASRLLEWAGAQRRVLVVVLDQAEELLTQASSPDERARACALLTRLAASPEQPSRVVLSVRGDYFHRLKELEGLGAAYDRNVKVLGRLGRAQTRKALEAPVERCGGHFEPGLVERMVDELDARDNALPLLQFAASSLWEARDPESGRLSVEVYERLGGASGALGAHADAVYGSLGETEKSLARSLLLGLVRAEGTRLIATEAELRARVGGHDVNRVLARLVDARLLTSREAEGTSPAGGYELIHESLVEAWSKLRAWRDEAQAGLAHLGTLREAVRAWEASTKSNDLLWRGDALAAHRAWAAESETGLRDEERAFVDASERAAARHRRRLRVALAVVFGAQSLLLAGVGFLVLRDVTHTVEELTREYQSQVVGTIHAAIESDLARAQDGLDLVGRIITGPSIDDASVERLAANTVAAWESLDHVAIYDADGARITEIREPRVGVEPPAELPRAVMEAAEDQGVGTGQSVPDEGHAPRILLAIPLRVAVPGSDGELVTGYAASLVSLDPVQARIEEFASSGFERDEVFVADTQGLVAHFDRARASARGAAPGLDLLVPPELRSDVRDFIGVGPNINTEGVPTISTSLWSHRRRLIIVVQAPESKVYRAVREMRAVINVVVGGAIFLALFTALVVARQLTRPIRARAKSGR
jgi:hypothetical protein